MEAAARMSSKGQIAVPKPVRDALDLHYGDAVVFRVESGRAVVARTPSLLDLAGSVDVPLGVRGATWDEIRAAARAARVADRH